MLDGMIPNRKKKIDDALKMNDQEFKEMILKRRQELDEELANFEDVNLKD